MALVQVSQGANGGPISTSLILNNWYLQPIPLQDDTISVSFQYPQGGVICSTTSPTKLTIACPSGMAGTKCMRVTCQGPAASSGSSGIVRALFTLCPAANVACGRHYAMEVSGTVSLVKAGNPVAPLPPPGPPSVPGPPQPGIDDSVIVDAGVPPVVADSAGDGNTNNQNPNNSQESGTNVGGIGNPPAITNSTHDQSTAAVVAAAAPVVPSAPPSPTSSGTSALVAYVGGAVTVFIAVLCAVAFFVQRHRREKAAATAENFAEFSLESRRSAQSLNHKPLPSIRVTLEGKYDPSQVVPAAMGQTKTKKKHCSLDDAVYSGTSRNWSDERRTLGSLERNPSSLKSKSSGVTLSSDRYRSIGAVEPNKGGTARGKKPSTRTSNQVVVIHPGYYDENGAYHYSTAEQMKRLQSKQPVS
ncbi:hypothetical protein BDR26DRAFT_1004563 [Obelidium mucronatum]|nr:hypothetical protein BDR26DRAFT_1004563 [Obelidium mucronatum]